MPSIRARQRWTTASRLTAEHEASGPATLARAFTVAVASSPCIMKRTTVLCALSLAAPWVPAVSTAGEEVFYSPALSLSSHRSSSRSVDRWSNPEKKARLQQSQQRTQPGSLSVDNGPATVRRAITCVPHVREPPEEVTAISRQPAITAALTTTAAVATTPPHVARGTLMVAVEDDGHHKRESKSSTAHKRGWPQQGQWQRRRWSGEGGNIWGVGSSARGWAFRPPPEGLQSKDDPMGSGSGHGPRESDSRTSGSIGDTSSTRSRTAEPEMLCPSVQNHATGPDITSCEECTGRSKATAATSFTDKDGQLQSPLPAQPVESRTTTTPLGTNHPDTPGPAAGVDSSGSVPGSGGGPAGRWNDHVRNGNGAMIAVFAGVVAAVLPELLRACKLMAVAGIAFRGMRWLAGAVQAVRPWGHRWYEGCWREGQHAKGKEASLEGVSKSFRRARESILLRANGMRVPADVVPCLDEAELEVAADLVDCDELDATFEDIAGMEEIKHSLQEIISEPLDFPPDLYPARLIKPCNGVLIYGPPGCGKTLLARAVARQSGAALISVKASTLTRKPGFSWDGARAGNAGVGGHSSLMVRAVFSLAKKIQPCVIFFDEADGLCLKREEGDAGSEREVMTELMQLWDELSSSGQDRVVVLAATNRPWDLDPAIQRRFSRSFQVGLPGRQMRKAVLMKALEDVDVEEGFDWREMAVMTEGYSCGDVVELCREAVRGPLREAVERNRRREARRHSQGLHQSRLHSLEVQKEQQQQKRRHRTKWQVGARGTNSMTSEAVAAAATASAEMAQLPPVRMRPLRMSDVTSAQRRVVPAFWQAEAYRTTYDSYMCSLMEHARQNWSR